MKSSVLIKKFQNKKEIEQIFQGYIFCLLSKKVKSNDSVMIKPNMVCGIMSGTGVTTHPLIVDETIKILKKIGVKNIVIAENAGRDSDTDDLFEKLGIKDVARKYNVPTIDLSKTDFVKVKLKKYFEVNELEVSKAIFDYSKIIVLPTLKTHHQAGISAGLKNMFGILSWEDMRKLHRTDLEKSIVDINLIKKPDFVIVDGIVGLEGIGPHKGSPVDANIIIAGDDPVAVDATCSEIIGVSRKRLRFLELANSAGLGTSDFRKISFTGDEIKSVRKKFMTAIDAVIEELAKAAPQVRIKNLNICNGCEGVIATVFMLLLGRHKFDFSKLKQIEIFYGNKKIHPKKNFLLIGDCIYKSNNKDYNAIRGCPPTITEVMNKIESGSSNLCEFK